MAIVFGHDLEPPPIPAAATAASAARDLVFHDIMEGPERSAGVQCPPGHAHRLLRPCQRPPASKPTLLQSGLQLIVSEETSRPDLVLVWGTRYMAGVVLGSMNYTSNQPHLPVVAVVQHRQHVWGSVDVHVAVHNKI